ncbi:lantibiotic dehydratase [Kitasatospora sp. NPDC127111]|uniref:lantibiotic dehydratase n=1 Tax=Kitasatospora sp. NPDC127111 TaxID=3345363 RepID=UPI00363D99CB
MTRVGPGSAPGGHHRRASPNRRPLTDLALGALRDRERVVELTDTLLTALQTWEPATAPAPLSLELSAFVAADSPAAAAAAPARPARNAGGAGPAGRRGGGDPGAAPERPRPGRRAAVRAGAAGRLGTDRGRLLGSYVHLHCNRLLAERRPSEGLLVQLLQRTRKGLSLEPAAARGRSRA